MGRIFAYQYKMRFTLVLISIFASVFGQEKPSLEEIEEARRLGKIRKDWSIKDGINKIQNPVAAAGELIEKILDSDSCEYVKDIDGSIIEKCPTSKLGDLVENTGRVVSNFAEEATEKIVSKFRKVELKLEGHDTALYVAPKKVLYLVRTLIGCGPQNLPHNIADFPDNGKKLLDLILYHTMTKDKELHCPLEWDNLAETELFTDCDQRTLDTVVRYLTGEGNDRLTCTTHLAECIKLHQFLHCNGPDYCKTFENLNKDYLLSLKCPDVTAVCKALFVIPSELTIKKWGSLVDCIDDLQVYQNSKSFTQDLFDDVRAYLHVTDEL